MNTNNLIFYDAKRNTNQLKMGTGEIQNERMKKREEKNKSHEIVSPMGKTHIHRHTYNIINGLL